MITRIKSLGEDYIPALLFHIFLPLSPIAIEYLYNKQILETSIVISISIYCFSLIVSTKSKFIFGTYIIVGALQGFYYGAVPKGSYFKIFSFQFWMLVLIILIQFVEKYRTHYIGSEPLLAINLKKEAK